MSLLKDHSLDQKLVQPFGFETNPSPHFPEVDSGTVLTESSLNSANKPISTSSGTESEVADLKERVRELETLLAREREKTKTELEAAHKKGRELGKVDAEKRDKERSALVENTLSQLRTDILEKYDAESRAAVEIARVTLQQILGEASGYTSLVERTAKYWASELADKTILNVRVSIEDFPDTNVLENISAELKQFEIAIDPDLTSGACLFDLHLGEVDASIPVQAKNADQLLAKQVSTRTGL